MITLEIFQKRRQTLINHMAPNSAALFFSEPELIRNNHIYHYRQNSNLWYFTGFNESQVLLMLIKKNATYNHSVLFNQPRSLLEEVWFGCRLGQEDAIIKQGVNQALPWNSIHEKLPQFLNGIDIIYHAQGENQKADKILFSIIEKMRCRLNRNVNAPHTMIDWRPWVHEMRLFKSQEEINILRQAGKITALAHNHTMKICRPGMFEYQLEGEIYHEFNKHGARFPSYNAIVGSGKNSCILHYTKNGNIIQNNDLVLIDAGCELYGYACDVTRTFPVNGQFNRSQKVLYSIVLAAQNKALSMFKPGITIQKVYDEVVRILTLGLINLDIIKGNLDTLLKKQAYYPFFMHNLSHWLGLEVHDVGDYGTAEHDRVLEPNMVLTVEPGLYFSADNINIPTHYRGIGIRIEDSIIITTDGNENITNYAVKDIIDIEKLMSM
ncbi:Xaa-Pro aminopeptidase [Pantoea sp. Aalb]|uniref:Xaa-Pro aminopeptidase n=1 Tax=Pantoea sp. Aalb TaxID=2576762 RepID=UPI001327A597|nr:Xaa-Pro aminopeptidase [Pantoea sp. Aalb]MXP67735.1 Xaa-Pro aminopeptidase [Pantoea sp. Aalb]